MIDKELLDKIKNSKDKIMKIFYDCFPEEFRPDVFVIDFDVRRKEENDEN